MSPWVDGYRMVIPEKNPVDAAERAKKTQWMPQNVRALAYPKGDKKGG